MEQVVLVKVRRQWNDYRLATYRLSDISGFHWSSVSGGVMAGSPRPFLHGYVLCTGMLDGDLAHSCMHGPAPHRIKVCITKRHNERVWNKILQSEAENRTAASAIALAKHNQSQRENVLVLARGINNAMKGL